jgi:cytochrome b561
MHGAKVKTVHHVLYAVLPSLTIAGYCTSLLATHYVEALMLGLYISSQTSSAIQSYGLVDVQIHVLLTNTSDFYAYRMSYRSRFN